MEETGNVFGGNALVNNCVTDISCLTFIVIFYERIVILSIENVLDHVTIQLVPQTSWPLHGLYGSYTDAKTGLHAESILLLSFRLCS